MGFLLRCKVEKELDKSVEKIQEISQRRDVMFLGEKRIDLTMNSGFTSHHYSYRIECPVHHYMYFTQFNINVPERNNRYVLH
ncbi:hypothetical protein TNCT_504081 [Trichonephila clavata]|uniref:Uncharacterized protein n=1 Tax=Trichonephila clavata TaxID=2740835 RepID=A0A8X6L1N5_TRICU|nr:hypothetical protein TNCT_504081 [Trichonephila clavata]